MTTLVTPHGGLGRVVGNERAKPAQVRGTLAAWIARWVDRVRARQQERALQVLMELDPRVRAEVDAAMARASGDR